MAFFTIPLLAAHLACMNIASAGPLVAIWFDARGRNGDADRAAAARWLAGKSVLLALVGALLGLLVGAIKWDSEYAAVLTQFKTRLWWGVPEFLFSVAFVAGYARWLRASPHASRTVVTIRSAISLLATTNLLYHFPPLFSLIAAASSGRHAGLEITSPVFRRLISQGEVPAISTHFFLASLAVTGTALVYRAWRASPEVSGLDKAAVTGARLALVATLLQVPAGLWLVLTVPAITQRQLLGADLLSAGLFILSLLGTLSLLHQLAAVAFGDTSRKALGWATGMMAGVVLLMVAVLHRVNG